MDALLTPEQVAELFQIEVSTVYDMVRKGKLQKVELGIKKYRFNKQYILSMCEPSSEDKTWSELKLEKENERLKSRINILEEFLLNIGQTVKQSMRD